MSDKNKGCGCCRLALLSALAAGIYYLLKNYDIKIDIRKKSAEPQEEAEEKVVPEMEYVPCDIPDEAEAEPATEETLENEPATEEADTEEACEKNSEEPAEEAETSDVFFQNI